MAGLSFLSVVRGTVDSAVAITSATVRVAAEVLGGVWPLNANAAQNAAAAAEHCADAAAHREEVQRQTDELLRDQQTRHHG